MRYQPHSQFFGEIFILHQVPAQMLQSRFFVFIWEDNSGLWRRRLCPGIILLQGKNDYSVYEKVKISPKMRRPCKGWSYLY